MPIGKNYQQAITDYKQALSIKPDAYDVMNNLALTLYKLNLHEESKAYSEKVIASNANKKTKAVTYFNLGMVFEKQQSLPLAASQKATLSAKKAAPFAPANPPETPSSSILKTTIWC